MGDGAGELILIALERARKGAGMEIWAEGRNFTGRS